MSSSPQEASRRRNKAKNRKEDEVPPGKDVATKQEYEIARWMRKNIQIKKTKFLSHTVEYFTASKAVDDLLDSPWAQRGKSGEDPLFTTRESIVKYLDGMLRHKLFHRARKIVVPESELKSKKKKDKEQQSKEDVIAEKDVTTIKKDKKKEDKETAAESSHAEAEPDQDKPETGKDKKKKKNEAEKKKRKIRLDMHLEQRFVDGLDAYVWIYEPTPIYYYFFGFFVVVAVIAVCLFPLWPSFVRDWVYYLSVAAAGFLVFILALAVLRLVIFSLLWSVTLGRHHLWLLPNLTEDVGFFASFWPLYNYEYKGVIEPEEDEEEEEEEEEEEVETGANDNNTINEPGDKASNPDTSPLSITTETGEEPKDTGTGSHSETESEASQPSQTGKDFEIVNKEEVDVLNKPN